MSNEWQLVYQYWHEYTQNLLTVIEAPNGWLARCDDETIGGYYPTAEEAQKAALAWLEADHD